MQSGSRKLLTTSAAREEIKKLSKGFQITLTKAGHILENSRAFLDETLRNKQLADVRFSLNTLKYEVEAIRIPELITEQDDLHNQQLFSSFKIKLMEYKEDIACILRMLENKLEDTQTIVDAKKILATINKKLNQLHEVLPLEKQEGNMDRDIAPIEACGHTNDAFKSLPFSSHNFMQINKDETMQPIDVRIKRLEALLTRLTIIFAVHKYCRDILFLYQEVDEAYPNDREKNETLKQSIDALFAKYTYKYATLVDADILSKARSKEEYLLELNNRTKQMLPEQQTAMAKYLIQKPDHFLKKERGFFRFNAYSLQTRSIVKAMECLLPARYFTATAKGVVLTVDDTTVLFSRHKNIWAKQN